MIFSGEGHGREKDAKISIYKKTDETYMLKMKNSREFFTAVNKKYQAMPFNLRNFDSETKAKMGVVECVTHKLVVPFQVLYEKEGKLHNIWPFFSALAIWRGIFNSQQKKKIKKIVKKPKWEASSVSLINSWYLFRSFTRGKVNYTIFDPFFLALAIWRDIYLYRHLNYFFSIHCNLTKYFWQRK